jgi:hypothetical protein
VQAGEIGTLTGATLAAFWDMGFMELQPGARCRMRMVRPVTNAINLTMRARVSERQGDAGVMKMGGALTASGKVPFRASGRFHRVRWDIPAGAEWSYVQGFEVDYDVGGER